MRTATLDPSLQRAFGAITGVIGRLDAKRAERRAEAVERLYQRQFDYVESLDIDGYFQQLCKH